MKVSKAGLDIIKRYEGFRSCPYLCPAGIPTIGYGTTHYDNRPVAMDDHCINEVTADMLLRHQVDEIYGKAVNHYVRVPITQNQFDALVSFTYNEGVNALRTSHLLKKLNNGTLKNTLREFAKWKYANNKVQPGLISRRKAEAELFLA